MTPLVEKFEQVVARMRGSNQFPYYMYGHRLEIANRLLEKDQDKVQKYQKYPLVALRQDFEEQHSNGIVTYVLNLAILEYTDKNYTAEQRYENVFKPILYPLYEGLIIAMRQSGFFWPGFMGIPPHTKIDRPYWGVQFSEKNARNIFNDPLDAIEIVNLKVNLKSC
ncbi:MAG: hypothetical protein KatS3mg031_2934 [Chitinophagales bacterium]|nr:MAG: hypothetical protein KatS3mg031_2934 [Chitinophagales bacterium]